MTEATPCQKKVLDAIKGFWKEHCMSPTIRELCDIVGISSPNGIVFNLKVLQRKGLIEWVRESKSRAIWPAGWRSTIRAAIGSKK